MAVTDRIEFTRVHLSPQGDTFFPNLPPAAWHEVRREDHPPGRGDDAAFSIRTYQRIASPQSV